jgi:hypothetical protein
VADRVARARDGLDDPELAAGAADVGRLPRSERAGDRDDFAGLEARGQPGAERRGLLGRGGDDPEGQKRPS